MNGMSGGGMLIKNKATFMMIFVVIVIVQYEIDVHIWHLKMYELISTDL